MRRVMAFLLLTAFLAAMAVAANFVWTSPLRADVNGRYPDLKALAIMMGSTQRTFGIYVPPGYSPSRPAPLIIALHGRFSSAKALHAMSHLQAVADARGAILLYPEAHGAFWGDGGHAALQRNEPEPDDVAFLSTLSDTIMAEYNIDPARVYLLGHDSGGAMAMRFLCQSHAPFHVAGVTIVSALMWDFTASACAGYAAPTSILFVHGRDSELFPTDGAGAQQGFNASRLSARDTLAFWRRVDGCSDAGGMSGSDGSVLTGCKSGTRVAYVGIPGARQAWVHDETGYRLNAFGMDTARLVDSFLFGGNAFTLPSPHPGPNAPRDYILYVPPTYEAGKPTPVMVLLHGRPSGPAEMARISNMNAVAFRHGFIVVYPEGLNHEWNAQFDLYTRSSRSMHTSGLEAEGLKQDDVGFLKTLVADLGVDLNIDRSRMYVAGFSNGGFMTLRMACSGSDTFAAFAEGGSALYPVMTDLCAGSKPAPMFFMHGTADPSIPYDGVRRRDDTSGLPARVTLSVKETVGLFARRNGCADKGIFTTFAESGRSPGTKLQRYIPNSCPPASPIVFYVVEGGGHTWPGSAGIMDEKRFGLTNMDMDASEKIWEFVSAQHLGQ
jgi:polyhydroxybutyrate depolymerase